MKLDALTSPATVMLHSMAQAPAAARDLLLQWEAATPASRIVRVVRGSRATTTADFFEEISAALQFPLYFGANWDALHDCLADLSWLHGDAIVILLTEAERLLEAEPEDELTKFIHVITEAAHYLAHGSHRKPRALHIVAQTLALPLLQRRWRSAGISLSPVQ